MNAVACPSRPEQTYGLTEGDINHGQLMLDQFLFFLSRSVSMLSGARNQKNTSAAQEYFDRIEKFFPTMKKHRLSAVILLANTYASTGNLTKAAELRKKASQMGIKKTAGLSWTVVNDKIVVSIINEQIKCYLIVVFLAISCP